MTTFVNALEDRLTMAAPSCYITTWVHNVENELPADSEQMPPGTLAAGLEMGDFLIARAPRPLVVLGQSNDFFDPRGTRETYEEVRKVYRLLGAEDSIRLTIGHGDHGYSKENREAMYSLFNDTAKVAAPAAEPASERAPTRSAFLREPDDAGVGLAQECQPRAEMSDSRSRRSSAPPSDRSRRGTGPISTLPRNRPRRRE